jgi:hypothetical protein
MVGICLIASRCRTIFVFGGGWSRYGRTSPIFRPSLAPSLPPLQLGHELSALSAARIQVPNILAAPDSSHSAFPQPCKRDDRAPRVHTPGRRPAPTRLLRGLFSQLVNDRNKKGDMWGIVNIDPDSPSRIPSVRYRLLWPAHGSDIQSARFQVYFAEPKGVQCSTGAPSRTPRI